MSNDGLTRETKTRRVAANPLLRALVNVLVHQVAKWSEQERLDHEADLMLIERWLNEQPGGFDAKD